MSYILYSRNKAECGVQSICSLLPPFFLVSPSTFRPSQTLTTLATMIPPPPPSSFSLPRPPPACSPPIDRLPKEILSEILFQVKITSSTSCLAQCLLCCKIWLDATLPLLYSDILLTNSNLEVFGKSFNITHAPLVCSLTMTIDPVQPAKDTTAPYPNTFLEDEQHMKQHGSQQSQHLWSLLRVSADKIATMLKMMTFSFTVSSHPSAIGFWIPRPLITEFVKILPETCVSVEVDSRGNDYFKPGDAHLCEALREILPRLRYLRVRLSTLCPAILGDGFNPSRSDRMLSKFTPVVAPQLKILIFNCIPRTIFGSQAHICGTFQENPYTSYTTNLLEARIVIVDALCLSRQTSSFPAAECLRVLHALPHSNNDNSVYASLLQRNILEDKTWSLPFRNIMGSQTDSFMIRTPDGLEFLSYSWAIEAFAEGELWGEVSNGFRVPASFSRNRTSVYVPKVLPLLDTKAWKMANPRKSCMLWLNEEVSGTRLLMAECSHGLSGVMPVKEKTPTGWTRDDGGQLQKD